MGLEQQEQDFSHSYSTASRAHVGKPPTSSCLSPTALSTKYKTSPTLQGGKLYPRSLLLNITTISEYYPIKTMLSRSLYKYPFLRLPREVKCRILIPVFKLCMSRSMSHSSLYAPLNHMPRWYFGYRDAEQFLSAHCILGTYIYFLNVNLFEYIKI